jgi:hypothetical protein
MPQAAPSVRNHRRISRRRLLPAPCFELPLPNTTPPKARPPEGTLPEFVPFQMIWAKRGKGKYMKGFPLAPAPDSLEWEYSVTGKVRTVRSQHHWDGFGTEANSRGTETRICIAVIDSGRLILLSV